MFGRVETAVKWYPSALLINVDFPTLGRPTIVTKPTRPLPNPKLLLSTIKGPYQQDGDSLWQVFNGGIAVQTQQGPIVSALILL